MTASFSRRATTACSTKRPPAFVSGIRGAPATNLTGLYCWPLMPLDSETSNRFAVETPLHHKQTFLQGTLDIVAGDFLTIGSTDYPIRFVSRYDAYPEAGDTEHEYHLVVEVLET